MLALVTLFGSPILVISTIPDISIILKCISAPTSASISFGEWVSEKVSQCVVNNRKSAIPTLDGFMENNVLGSNTFIWYYQ